VDAAGEYDGEEFERSSPWSRKDADLQDLDLTPRDALIQMGAKGVPGAEFHTVMKDGAEISVPVLTAQGIRSFKAAMPCAKLLSGLHDIKVPDAPLDMILQEFGPDMVAEVTGAAPRWFREGRVWETKIILKSARDPPRARRGSLHGRQERDLGFFSGVGGTGSPSTPIAPRKPSASASITGELVGAPIRRCRIRATHRSNEANQPKYKAGRDQS